MTACASGTQETNSAAGARQTESRLSPAYVYPTEPPLVDRPALENLIVRLDGRQALILYLATCDERCDRAVRFLSGQRDALRHAGIALVGVYGGLPQQWTSQVLPMLRRSDGNFIFAVVAPGHQAAIEMWLDPRSELPPPRVVLLDRMRRMVSVAPADEDHLEPLIDHLLRSAPGP